jgi:hypothetical protein
VAGVAVLGVRALRGGTRATLVVAAGAPVTLLYLARPSVSPDQLWAMRRFLPMTLPLFAIAAVVAVAAASAAVARKRTALRAPVALLGIALLLAPAVYAGAPFVRARMQAGARRAVLDVCRAAGSNAAIAVAPYGNLGAELPATLRAFCGVPSAAMLAGATRPLAGYATAWRSAGRVLYVVTAARPPVLALAPGAVEVAHLVVADEREPERTLTRAPRHDAPRRVELWLYRIAAG